MLCALTSGARAADLAPAPSAIARSANAGIRAASEDEGYPVKDHILYAVKNALTIDPADGEVDAIAIATPLERTRHAAFLAARANQRLTATEAYREAALPPGFIAVIIYAHGANPADESFVGRFGRATLVLGSEIVDAETAVHSDPSDAVYPQLPQDRHRQVATITYRFDLSRWPDAGARVGRLLFTDGSGKAFNLPLDLARFE